MFLYLFLKKHLNDVVQGVLSLPGQDINRKGSESTYKKPESMPTILFKVKRLSGASGGHHTIALSNWSKLVRQINVSLKTQRKIHFDAASGRQEQVHCCEMLHMLRVHFFYPLLVNADSKSRTVFKWVQSP